MFGVVPPGDVYLVEGGGYPAVLGADHRPAKRHRRQIVVDAGSHADIFFPGRAALAGLEIHYLMAAAVIGEIGDAFLQRKVEFLVRAPA